jgi:hypothetical protein
MEIKVDGKNLIDFFAYRKRFNVSTNDPNLITSKANPMHTRANESSLIFQVIHAQQGFFLLIFTILLQKRTKLCQTEIEESLRFDNLLEHSLLTGQ